MNIPRPITTIPQSRRYKRRFKSLQAKTFYEGDQVTIQIPPIERGYLTKNQKLHFEVNVKWTAMSQKMYTTMLWDMVSQGKADTYYFNKPSPPPDAQLILNQDEVDWLNAVTGKFKTSNPANAYFQVTPCMDINGPYGFIESIQVQDFLGTTVLEDVPNHHLLTSQFADIWLKHENLDPYRPRLVDTGTGYIRKASAVSVDGSSFPYQITDSLPVTTSVGLASPYITATPFEDEMTAHMSIDLYSMLHKLSPAFVPLHNGFSITIKLRNCLSFETLQPNLRVIYHRKTVAVGGPVGTIRADPTLTNLSFSNVYLEADVLELTPELDQQVDKIIHYQGWKYQQNTLPPMSGKRAIYSQQLYPELKSVNRVYIAQRKLVTQYPSIRVRNNLTEALLQYNKAQINSSLTLQEFLSAWSREEPDEYLNASDFLTNFDTNGARLYIGALLRTKGKTSMDELTPTLYPGDNGVNAYDITNSLYYSWAFDDTGLGEQGRFLVILDSKIPSAGDGVVAGIDTTRHALEYQLTYGTATSNNVAVDCFLLHDAVVTVIPGEKTSVSF